MKKAFKIGALVLGVLFLLVGVVYFSFHFFFKEKLAQELSKKLKGEVHFSDLDLSLYPKPGVKIKGFEIKTPRYLFRFQSCIFVVKFRPLLSKHLEVDRFLLVKPELTIFKRPRQPPKEPSPASKEKKSFKFPETIFQELKEKTASLPEFRLELEDGKVVYIANGEILAQAHHLEGVFSFRRQFLEFELKGRTPATEEFFLSGRIWPEEQITEGLLELKRLRLEKAPFLTKRFTKEALKSDISLKATYRYEEKAWLLGFNITSSCLSKPGKKRHLLFECAALLGKARLELPYYQVEIQQWHMKEPLLKASGHLERSKKGYAFAFQIEEGEWQGIRERLLSFLGKHKSIRTLCGIIQEGKIKGASFESQASKPSKLFSLKNMSLNGLVEEAKVALPSPKIVLHQLSGQASLQKGLLKISQASGRYRESSLQEGRFLLDLTRIKDRSSPFELHVKINQGLFQDTLALLHTISLPAKLKKELSKTDGEGPFKGRVDLQGTLKHLKLSFQVQPQKLKIRYNDLPFPLFLEGGRISYAKKVVSVRGLNVRSPKSRLKGLTGAFSFSERPYRLDLEQARGEVELNEVYSLLKQIEQVTRFLEKYSLKGEKIEILGASFHGPLKGSEILQKLYLRARGENLVLTCPQLPGPLSLSKTTFAYLGNFSFEVEPSEIRLLDAQALLNGKLTVKPFTLRLEGQGRSNRQFVDWIFKKGKIPRRYFPRTPLEFPHLFVEISSPKIFLETQVVRSGHQASLKIEERPGHLNLKINLQAGEEPFSLHLTKAFQDWRFSLKGNLDDQGIKIFLVKNPFLFQFIKADFKGRFNQAQPLKSSFVGKLHVSRFKLPWKRYPFWIEDLDLQAQKRLLYIKKLEMDLDGLSFEAHGRAEFTPELLNLEASVYSPMFLVEEILPYFQKKEGKKKKKGKKSVHEKLKLVARLNLTADAVIYKNFEFTPFEGTLFYHPGNLRLVIKNTSLCDINLWGAYVQKAEQKGLTLNFEQPEGDLRKTMSCLFESRLLEGPFWLKGYLKTEGKKLLENSSGNFSFSSSKGHIYKFGTLAKIFSVLSPLDIFQGNLPDFHKKGTDFNLWKIKGHFEKHYLVVDSWLLEAPGFRVFASGKLNLLKQKIDFTVFVSPFETVDSVVSKVPLVGWILTGNSKTFFAVPVKVSGKLGDPSVTPLSPTAVGGKALGIIKRTLQLPIKILSPKKEEPSLTAPEEAPEEEAFPEIKIQELPPEEFSPEPSVPEEGSERIPSRESAPEIPSQEAP